MIGEKRYRKYPNGLDDREPFQASCSNAQDHPEMGKQMTKLPPRNMSQLTHTAVIINSTQFQINHERVWKLLLGTKPGVSFLTTGLVKKDSRLLSSFLLSFPQKQKFAGSTDS